MKQAHLENELQARPRAISDTNKIIIITTNQIVVFVCFSSQVARGALFLGKAMVHTATIGGRLEGILVASGTLTMKAAGHCDGVLRYGNVHVQVSPL